MGDGPRKYILLHSTFCIWFVSRNLYFPSASPILTLHRSALFYGGYGVILIPALGIADAYGGYTPEYHNALGFFVLCKLCPSLYCHFCISDIFPSSMGGLQPLLPAGQLRSVSSFPYTC